MNPHCGFLLEAAGFSPVNIAEINEGLQPRTTFLNPDVILNENAGERMTLCSG